MPTISLDDVKEALGQVVNYCPFGCQDAELDERGYCRHLVGFTNNGKEYEQLQRLVLPDGEDAGLVRVVGDEVVKAGKESRRTHAIGTGPDWHVETGPVEDQVVNGALNKARKWFSSRVYHKHADPTKSQVALRRPGKPAPAATESEIDKLRKELAELKTQRGAA